MADTVIWHNPNCSNSRGALELLRERGIDHEVVQYIKQPPSREELARVVAALETPPADLVRKDKRFGELGLDAADYTTAEQVVDLLVAHPELMQRPVVIQGGRAVIARPPSTLETWL
jgi:arsenate reductase (glutaredoxin)